MKPYRHIVEYASRHNWALEKRTLDTMLAIFALRLQGERLSDDEIAERLAAARTQQGERRGRQTGAIAVIPVYGVLIPRASMFDDLSGGTSVEQLRADFRAALADDEVSRIIFDVDSPGGSVEGIPEFAREIRAARGQKPMQAIANYQMCSAAYYLGSQADEVIASPSAMVGSIGVYSIHQNLAAAYEMEGIQPTLIKAGKFKAEGNDLGPLSAEALEHIQESVNYSYGQFTTDVAVARGVTRSAVESGYGEGRALDAEPAKAAGLIDRIATFDEVRNGKPPAMRPPGRKTDELMPSREFVEVATSGDPAFAFERERRARRGLRPV